MNILSALFPKFYPARTLQGDDYPSELVQQYLDQTTEDHMSDLSIRSKEFIREEARRAAKRTVETGQVESNPYDSQIAAAWVWHSEYALRLLAYSHEKHGKEAA